MKMYESARKRRCRQPTQQNKKAMMSMFSRFRLYRTAPLLALSLLIFFPLSANAQTAGSNVLNVGWLHLYTDDASQPLTRQSPAGPATMAGSGATVSNANTPGLAYTRYLTDHFSLTLDIGLPPEFKLDGTGTLAGLHRLGTARQWSPALIAKWHFGEPNRTWRPYVGLGITHVWYSSIHLSSSLQTAVTAPFNGGVPGTATASLSSSWAPVFNVGVNYKLDRRWSIGVSLSYIPLDTDVEITGRNAAGAVISRHTTDVALDPYVGFLSLGYHF